MVDRSHIRVKAFAVLRNRAGTHHAVLRGYDPGEDQEFHRLLGGGIELGERSEAAVTREIAEELGATMLESELLGVVENIFEFDGQAGHEVVFVYAGRLAEGDHVPPEGGTYADNGVPMRVEWRALDDHDLDLPLYPDGARELLG